MSVQMSFIPQGVKSRFEHAVRIDNYGLFMTPPCTLVRVARVVDTSACQ